MDYQETVKPLIDSLEEFRRSEILLILKCVSSCKYLVNKWKGSTLNIGHLNRLLLNLNFRGLASVFASTSFFFFKLRGMTMFSQYYYYSYPMI